MRDYRLDPKKRCIILVILACILLAISIASPHLMPNDPNKTNVAMAKHAPCDQYPLGTDALGRCVMSRVLIGSRTSIFASLLLVAIMFCFGSAVGIVCGYYGGVLDTVLMRITDCFLALPQMVLAIAVAGILGGGLLNAMIALGGFGWTSYARLARSRVLALKNEDFIAAARLSNNRDGRILLRHVMPNILSPLLVNASIQIGYTMLSLAGLSFLGLGVQVPKAEWGSMVSDGRSLLQVAPWVSLVPAAAIIITVIVFNLLADSIRDVMDPGESEA
jgi:peptide/nickel transport system permease protein